MIKIQIFENDDSCCASDHPPTLTRDKKSGQPSKEKEVSQRLKTSPTEISGSLSQCFVFQAMIPQPVGHIASPPSLAIIPPLCFLSLTIHLHPFFFCICSISSKETRCSPRSALRSVMNIKEAGPTTYWYLHTSVALIAYNSDPRTLETRFEGENG